jgi:hypothetical protein
MYEIKDKFEDIAISKLVSVLSKYSKDVFKENGDLMDLLKCIGLTDVAKKYENKLDPNSFNGKHKNVNSEFNPREGLHDIVDTIKSNEIALGNFFQEYVERVNKLSESDFVTLSDNFSVIGYSLEVIVNEEEVNFDGDCKIVYKLLPSTTGVYERKIDISYLTGQIENKHNKYLHFYSEAIDEYGDSHYIASIGSCRILIEKIFEEADSINQDHNKGFLNITGEETPSGCQTPKLTQQGIFNFWLKEKKGFNRYRLFVTMYSLFSGLGQHGEEKVSKYDALLCLRMTEDILIWAYQGNKF